jgi:hypothetical protein
VKQAAQERAQYEASRERQRVNFEKQLEQLQRAYANQELTTAQFHANLIKLFKKFEIPLGKAANALGAALASGLRASIADAQKAARELASAIRNALENIKVVINIQVTGKEPDKRQFGGLVKSGSPYIVGEAGPELFVPRSSGTIHTAGATARMASSGGNVTQNFYGTTVGTSREFEDTVRRALYDVNRRNPGFGFAT